MGAGCIAAFGSEPKLSPEFGWGIVAAEFCIAVGCIFCLRAASSAALNLPGRGAEFWLWAAHEQVTKAHATKAYLDNIAAKQALNREVNRRTAAALKRAKQAGICAPLIGTIAGLVAIWITHL